MSWYLAKSIKKFRDQIDAIWSGRDKVSDGYVGDTSHSRRKSSHNPDSRGAVRAMDVTHSPKTGADCNLLLAVLIAKKDSRIWYIIFNSKIYNRKTGFKAEPYSGPNAHKHHLHLSVADAPEIYDNDADWDLSGLSGLGENQTATEKPTPTVSSTFAELKIGAKGEAVRKLQEFLARRGCLKTTEIDGDFGAKTERAVKDFQILSKLRVDGIVGKNIAKLLGLI